MSNKNVVTVVANKSGAVVSTSPNNPEFGWLCVESIQPTFQGGFLRLGKRVAFIAGKVDELNKYVGDLSLVAGSELPGKIVVKESLIPVSATDATMGVKYPNAAAKTQGLACLVDDQPVYRKSMYTPNVDELDILVQHTNGDEIRAFMNAGTKTPTPEQRLAELQAIPKAQRTAAQKAELAELVG
jgi:hypothetical protein